MPALPTATPIVAQPLPTPVPTEPVSATANGVANVRSGPGTTYDVAGSVTTGSALTIVGRNAAGDWYRLSDGTWIAAFLVTGAPPDVAVVDAPPVPETPADAAPVIAVEPTVMQTPAEVAPESRSTGIQLTSPVCDCSGDNLNCGNFGTHAEAQACFDYCMATVGSDVHKLDQNNDGDACESLP